MSNNFLSTPPPVGGWRNKESSQRGVALLVTFFVMGISVAIVLGVSIILLSELKMIRGMGDSVKAFYSAETGIEKTLYYDGKVRDAGQSRGICNICVSCLPGDCQECTRTGPDCAPEACTDCTINYTTDMTNTKFRMEVTVLLGSDDIYRSYGTYKKVTRAIELSGSVGSGSTNQGPSITDAHASPRSVPAGTVVDIIATIYDTDGLDPSSLVATIRNADFSDTVTLENSQGNSYSGSWSGVLGVYYVDITACDMATPEKCTGITNI